MSSTYDLRLAQSNLSEALEDLRAAQNHILTSDNIHPYLAKRIQQIINTVHKFQNDVANFVENDHLEVAIGSEGES